MLVTIDEITYSEDVAKFSHALSSYASEDYDIYVLMTGLKENIDKIKNLYNDNISVYTYYIANDKLNSEQLKYDSLLSSTDDSSKIKEVVNNILNLYRDNLDIKLISG